MNVITKSTALRVIGRAYGPERAEVLAERLPDRIDLDDPADIHMLDELGLTRDELFNSLGAEL
jgi:hypothetical protein